MQNRSSWFNAIAILFIGVGVFAVYGQTIHFQFIYGFDDDLYIAQNERVQEGLNLSNIKWAFTTFYAANWHPVTWLSHMTDAQLFGMDSGKHHLTSIIVHLLNAALLYWVFRYLTGSFWSSLLVALLFAVHPLHVESVAQIAQRKDLVSTFFGVATIGTFAIYAKHSSYLYYVVAILLFLIGLMAKPMLVTIPVLLLLLDYWPLNRMSLKYEYGSFRHVGAAKRFSALVFEKTPFFILSCIFCVITIHAQGEGGAIRSLEAFPLMTRLSNATISTAMYLLKLIRPVNLTYFYPYPTIIPAWKLTISLITVLGITVFAFRNANRRPYIIIGWLWFLIALLPVIGIVQVGGQSMADRYAYLPGIGIYIIIAWILKDIQKKSKKYARYFCGGLSIWITILMTSTWIQVGFWKDSLTLFQHALQITDNNYVTHYNVGVMLYNNGKIEDARRHYSEAIRINPNYAKAHNNLGAILAETGRHEAAMGHYAKAIRLRPAFVDAYANMGASLAQQGKNKRAIEYFQRALEVNPESAAIYSNLAVAYYNSGNTNKAIESLKRAIQIEPQNEIARNNLRRIVRLKEKDELGSSTLQIIDK